jgi:CubicO group peptidase (beta-lactamase class C family)
VVWAEAFGGDLTVDTPVDIASVSKQFTANAVLLLDIDLDSTVDDHLDGLPAWAGEVTVRQLVQMESGIPDYTELLPDELVTDNDDVYDLLAVTELGEPEYSNSNYVLLAEIVEAVTGDDFADVLAAELFEPLDLDAAVDPRGTARQVGDGAIRTTPTELVTWAAQYWAPTIGGDDINRRRLENAESYGAGIISVPDDDLGPLLYHDGLWDHVTTFDLLPESRLAAAVTCTDPEMPEAEDDLAYELLQIWLSEMR